MTTSKFNIIAMSACCFLALGNKPSRATASPKAQEESPLSPLKETPSPKKSDIETLLDTLKTSHSAYLQTKIYTNINDKELKKQVENACKWSCNRFTCGSDEYGAPNTRRRECRELCPEHDIQNCLKPTKLNEMIKEIQDKYSPYLTSKNYNDILNKELREQVKQACKRSCNWYTCTSSELDGDNNRKKECRDLCPAEDIKHCLQQ